MEGRSGMDMKKVFCEVCRADVFYTVKEEIFRNKLKGETYEYVGRKCVCSTCGAEVYVADIEDENLKLLYDEYRQKNEIISLEKIMEIPDKYNIGKRPLSLLLGWGEMTFSRYYEGYVPTKQYSDILQRIYDEPNYFLELLEKNRDKLKSQNA